jgi:hypothetical protein
MSARLWAWAAAAAGMVASAAWLAWCGWLAGPWGVARPPAEPPRADRSALLVTADQRDAATLIVGTLRHVGPPAGAVVTVQFLRGERHGRKRVWIDCGTPGMLMLADEHPRHWHRDGGTLLDLIGDAACADHPLLLDEKGRAA